MALDHSPDPYCTTEMVGNERCITTGCPVYQPTKIGFSKKVMVHTKSSLCGKVFLL